MGGKGLSQSRGVEALEAGRSKGLMRSIGCVVWTMLPVRHASLTCGVLCKSFKGVVTVSWCPVVVQRGESKALHTRSLVYIVDASLRLEKGEVRCEGQPNGRNWERVHW